MAMVLPKTIIISLPNRAAPTIFNTSLNLGLSDSSGVRKRRRLTHLSQDERMMRRKLKNRIAAQTARDRKKEKMETIEEQLAKLEAENQRLKSQNATLQQKTTKLVTENASLKERLCAESREASHGFKSAEGANPCDVSLDDALHSLSDDTKSSTLMEILEELTRASSKVSASPTDNNRTQVPVVGPTAAELESIKELIRFDHEYIKTEPVETVVITDDDDNSTITSNLDTDMEMEYKNEETTTDSATVAEDKSSEFGDIDLEQFTSSMDFESLLELDSLPDELKSIIQPSIVKKEQDTSVSSKEPSTKKARTPASLNVSNTNSLARSFSLNSPVLLEEPQWPGVTLSDSGYSSDEVNSDVASPRSDYSTNLDDDIWEESFTELFPSLA